MSLATAVRDARHSRRVQRAQAQVVRRYWSAAGVRNAGGVTSARWRILAIWVWSELRQRALTFVLGPLVPLLVPLFAWLGVHEDRGPWPILACLLVLASSGHQFQSEALEFAAGDVLRHPSKAGLLLLRIWRQTPALLLIGVCWSGACGLLLGAALSADPVRSAPLLLAVLLSPLAWTVGKLLCRLLIGGTSELGRLALPALFGTFTLGRLSGRSVGFGGTLGWILAAALGVLALIGGVRAWNMPPHLRLRVLGAELAMLPRLMFAFCLLLPRELLRDPAVFRPVAWSALPFVLCSTLYALAQLVRAVRRAEERTPGSAIHRVGPDEPREDDQPHVAAVLPEAHPGRRSLTRAAVYRHRRQLAFRSGELASPRRVVRSLPQILAMAIYHAWGPLLATLVVLRTTGSNVHTTLALLAGATAPAFVTIKLSFDLHRLGVDYLEQARHNLRALVWFAVLPTLLAAVLAGTLAGWNADRSLAVAVLAAVFAVRAGWRGLLDDEATRRHDGLGALAAVVLMGASLFLPLASWWVASAAAGIGCAGVFLRLRRSDERTLAEVVRERDELRA